MKNLNQPTQRKHFTCKVRTILASSNINRKGLKLLIKEEPTTKGWLPTEYANLLTN